MEKIDKPCPVVQILDRAFDPPAKEQGDVIQTSPFHQLSYCLFCQTV